MNPLPLPTPDHLAWQDRELGVLIHQDLEVYDPGYHPGEPDTLPPPSVYNPKQLDTDQWLEAAAAAGCRSAVLVAKHMSGFTFFPSEAHDFGVGSSPWRGGKGDVLADFVASCERHRIKPGFYFSVGDSDYLRCRSHRMRPDAGIDWAEYRRLTLIQCREIWSRYGDLGELWFDGWIWPEAADREALEALVNRYQPHAMCFGGRPESSKAVRHSGNEDGLSLPWCYSGSDAAPCGYWENMLGRRDGRYWYPLESIVPNRDNHLGFMAGWFWRAGEDHTLFRPADLLERYYTSVGVNSTLMIGMAIDDRGLVPEADCRQFAEFGRLVEEQFRDCIGSCAGRPGETRYEIANPDRRAVNLLELTEEIAFGERIVHYKLLGVDDAGGEVPLYTGDLIGHRRLARFPAAHFRKFRLVIRESVDAPRLGRFALYHAPRH